MPIQAAEKITAECELRTSEIPSVFDKLLFLTSVQRWLGAKHRQLFDEWLSSPLEEQYAMLSPRYHDAAESGELPAEAFALTSFSRLIPAGGIEEGPRTLFYSNLDHILDILKVELPVSAPPRPLAFASLGSTREWLFHSPRFADGQAGASGLLPIRETDNAEPVATPAAAPSAPQQEASAPDIGMGTRDDDAWTTQANIGGSAHSVRSRTPPSHVAYSSRVSSTWNLDHANYCSPVPGNLSSFNAERPVAAARI